MYIMRKPWSGGHGRGHMPNRLWRSVTRFGIISRPIFPYYALIVGSHNIYYKKDIFQIAKKLQNISTSF